MLPSSLYAQFFFTQLFSSPAIRPSPPSRQPPYPPSPLADAGDPLKFPPLRQRIEAEGKVTDPEEVDSLFSFLKACWTLDPEKRPSAKELLEHEWLRRVE